MSELKLLTGSLLLTCSLCWTTHAMEEEKKPVNKWAEQVRDRGDMLHWKDIKDYLSFRGEKKKFLVVGCGHGAFSYNKETGNVKGMRLPSPLPYIDVFSHPNAFTINAYDGEYSTSLSPDINGFFPDALPKPAQNIFDEIFFESVNGGTSQYYEAAFQYLNPGGQLVDDRYGDSDSPLDYRKSIAIERLIKAGFSNIQFQDNITNPRNGRKYADLVIATKLEKTSEDRSAFEENNPFLTEIDNNVKKMKESGDFTNEKLNSYLRGWYRNVPEMFERLYFKYRIPVKTM